MYNLQRGPKPGQKFHPRGDGNGYVLTLGGRRFYIAGDTEAIPEMRNLKNIDVAFLPMNLPFTMTPQEAAQGARSFKPKMVYPYHYRYPFNKVNNHPQQFQAALQGSGIQVRLRNWYPQDAVQRATQAAAKR
jgi:L-ascorbate metabolism protein UlaG (beta-lactamase superfamily)